MYSYTNLWESFRVLNSFRVLYECFPRTLRTSLNSPYTPYSPNTPNIPNELNRVKHFEPLGLSSLLKEIDFNSVRYAWRGKRIEPIEPLELLRGL